MNTNLLSLLQLSDPTLPIGGYAHSAGLETYVQQGIVHDKVSANAFITGMLCNNIRYTDAAFVSLAFDAAASNDIETILQIDIECTAVKIPREMRQASQKLGMRLIKIFQPITSDLFTAQYKAAVEAKQIMGHYCIGFGLYAYALGIDKLAALTGFFYNAAAGMVTNSVKLVPLGQQDGQEILFSLQPILSQLAEKSLVPDRGRIGLCCPGFDIRCMQHEQLYSRLYMS